MTRLRSSEDGGWTATYLLAVRGTDGDVRTVTAHGTLVPDGEVVPDDAGGRNHQDGDGRDATGFGEDGWACWLPDLRLHLHTWSDDPGLPGLHALTHESSALPLLQQLLEARLPTDGGERLVGCRAAVISYKPGLRATVACDLEVAPTPGSSAWPRSVVAKVHRPEDGRACHDLLEALWSSPLRDSREVRLAEPLGYVDALGISVQSHLDHERTLKDVLAESFSGPDESAQVVDTVRAAARALASLHACGVADGLPTTWAEELGAVEEKHARLAAVAPWLADLTGAALERIAAAGASVDPDPAAPAHGSFRPAQVLLLDRGGLGLIDLDKAAQAEPAVDIALFLVKLRHSAVNKSGDDVTVGSDALEERSSRVDRVADGFLAAYRELAPVTDARVRLWESLELFSLVLSAAKKTLPHRAATCAAMLHRHLLAHGVGT